MTDKAFEAFVAQYNPMMYKFINNTFVSGYEREDLYQEALMVLYTTIQNFDETKGAAFSTYLYTNLRNMFVNLIRKHSKDTNVDLVFVDNNSSIIMNELYNENKESVEDYGRIITISNELLKMNRGEITYLHYVVGLTQVEIAEMEGISKQRVNYINNRNIKNLKELYESGGFTL